MVAKGKLQGVYTHALRLIEGSLCLLLITKLFMQFAYVEHACFVTKNLPHYLRLAPEKAELLLSMRHIKVAKILRITMNLTY